MIVYELTTLRKPNFLGDKEPKDVFIDGWKPDLSAVEDDSIRTTLGRIFVLDPVKRPTARELAELFNPSISSTRMLRLRAASLEEALAVAGARINTQSARISTLRRDLAIKSSTIDSLKQQFTKAIEDLK